MSTQVCLVCSSGTVGQIFSTGWATHSSNPPQTPFPVSRLLVSNRKQKVVEAKAKKVEALDLPGMQNVSQENSSSWRKAGKETKRILTHFRQWE